MVTTKIMVTTNSTTISSTEKELALQETQTDLKQCVALIQLEKDHKINNPPVSVDTIESDDKDDDDSRSNSNSASDSSSDYYPIDELELVTLYEDDDDDTTSPKSPTFSLFPMTPKKSAFSVLKDAFSTSRRPRGVRHLEKMFTELGVPIPTGQDTIVFSGYVVKWTSNLFKKNSKNFLVLTHNFLCQLKGSEKKYAEKSFDGSPDVCTLSSCIDDYFSLQPSLISPAISSLESPNDKVITLDNIILSLSTVYSISQQISPEPVIRIDYLVSLKKHAYLSMVLQSQEEHDQWIKTLRTAARNVNTVGPLLTKKQRDWVTDRLKNVSDVDVDVEENNFVAFRVLMKAFSDKGAISDHEKQLNLPVMFVLGRNNVYMLPIKNNDGTPNNDHKNSKTHRYNNISNNTNLISNHNINTEDKSKEIDIYKYQYPLLCLTAIHADGKDDTFQLVFKNSSELIMRTMLLSSSLCETIVTSIRTAIDAITIWWPQPCYQLHVPNVMQGTMIPQEAGKKEIKVSGIDRMLEAQCYVFRVNRKRIAYSIECAVNSKQITPNLDVEHLPFRFVLLLPEDNTKASTYTNAELMTIFSSLRYHPLLHELILQDVNLFDLQIQQGPEGHKCANMLAATLYDLLLSNTKLRHLNLTGCGITGDTLSAIGYALMTGRSSLDRLVLANTSLTRDGAQALASGITAHGTPIRELDISNGHIAQKSLESILDALDTNFPDQLELLNLSKNSCDLESDILVDYLAKTVALKNLNLRSCAKFFKSNSPIISTRSLGNTLLTTLDLGGVPLNHPVHTAALFEYMRSDAFACLRLFSIDQCSFDGGTLAAILSIIATAPNRNKLRVWAGANNICESETGHQNFCQVIRDNQTPFWLSMIDTTFGLNSDQVIELIQAFNKNTSIKSLDLSYPQFGAEKIDGKPNPMVPIITKKACEHIGILFKENKSIREIILRGEGNRRWGPSLGFALNNLEDNRTIEKLIIRGNAIGDDGAKHLSQALKTNSHLRMLNIDENEIGVDGYDSLHIILSTHQNITLQEFTYPAQDIQTHVQNLDTKISIINRESNLFSIPTTAKISARMASERQKFSFHELVEEIMAVVKLHKSQAGAWLK
ncbi:4230_t:CDS:2 [Ambispora gerdemannii]|uniref:4230_t:CDS:1 n=1 Tax=Ambispora gerdemannii TaxID=144530 RepID=A0A9N9BSS5_9GLOM|nr:4230_t:CDS:2 [Ambispora gerdemannii]